MSAQLQTQVEVEVRPALQLVRRDELMKSLGVSKPVFYRMLADGKLPPCFRLSATSRTILWREADVRAFLDARMSDPETRGVGALPPQFNRKKAS
jgi:predicted DNA-binding transcriptional regulator AlpA